MPKILFWQMSLLLSYLLIERLILSYSTSDEKAERRFSPYKFDNISKTKFLSSSFDKGYLSK